MKRKIYGMCIMSIMLMLVHTSCAQQDLTKRDPCRNPEYVNVLKEQVRDFYGRGDFRSSLKAAMTAQECEPEDPEIHYWLGLNYYRLEKNAEALQYLKKAAKLQEPNTPEIGETHMALGVIYLQMEQWDEAINMFDNVVDNLFFPRNWEAYNNLGWAYFEKGELDKAEKNFSLALKYNSSFCPAYSNLGEVYLKKAMNKEAVQVLQKAAELCPDYARVHLLLGVEYNRTNAKFDACREFARAYKIDPRDEQGRTAEEYMKLLNCPIPPLSESTPAPK